MECGCKKSCLWSQHRSNFSKVVPGQRTYFEFVILYNCSLFWNWICCIQGIRCKMQPCGIHFCFCSSIWRVYFFNCGYCLLFLAYWAVKLICVPQRFEAIPHKAYIFSLKKLSWTSFLKKKKKSNFWIEVQSCKPPQPIGL